MLRSILEALAKRRNGMGIEVSYTWIILFFSMNVSNIYQSRLCNITECKMKFHWHRMFSTL